MKRYSVRLSIRAGIAAAILLTLAALAGCTAQPPGPSVMALPGSGASFDRFRADDARCQAYALEASGGVRADTARKSAVDSAVVGTAVGAAAGALIGGASGDVGDGAAIGAASGLLIGGAAATGAYEASGARAQERFDMAYVQCMYSAGHQVPVPASAAALTPQRAAPVPPAPPGMPPPGTPPPPGY